MKKKTSDIVGKFPPAFFSKLGEAMKRIDQYERHLMINIEDTKVEENALPEKLRAACAWCGKMRDEDGFWRGKGNPEKLSHDRLLTHGICPECLAKLKS